MIPAATASPSKVPPTDRKPESKAATRKAVPASRPPSILEEGDVTPSPIASGPGGRFVLGPVPTTSHGAPPRNLPEAYGTGRLLLVARDPRWLYAHWDLTDAQIRDYNRQSSTGHLLVRVHEGSFQKPHILEQEVHPESRSWFLNVPGPGASYLAELGYRDSAGVWQRISQSGATLTPSDELSPENWVRFETLPFEVSREKVVELVKEAAITHRGIFDAVLGQAGSTSATAAPSGSAPASLPKNSARPARGKQPAPTPAWTPEQERALEEVLNIDEVRRVWIGSLEITELLRRQLVRGISSTEIQLRAEQAGAAGGIPGHAESSLSSPFGGAPSQRRGFRFEVNAELIVYGATEPDATVTIGGRRIQLRPDGSFTYRFSLPDGQYALPIVATAADAHDQRSAALSFSRESTYLGGVGTHPQDAALRPPSPENVA